MEYKVKILKNGLRAVAINTPEFKSIHAELIIWAGPGFETKEVNGISHFVEHMILQGTASFPDKDRFDEEIEYLGGGYNAYTSYSKLGVRISLPDNQLDMMLKFLYEVAYEATFPLRNLATERTAILDEIHNYETSPYRKFSNFYDKVRYTKGSTPLKVLGSRTNIKNMKRARLLEWYSHLFNPENIALCIAGNLEVDQTLDLIEKRFGGVKIASNGFSPEKIAKDKLTDKQIATQLDREQKQSIGIISFKGLEFFSADLKTRLTARIIQNILANMRSSILFKKLRKELGMIYDIGATQSFGINSPGVFEIEFTTSDDKISKVYEIIFDELVKIRKSGFTKEQLKLGIESSNNSLKMGYTSIGDIISWCITDLLYKKSIYTVDEIIDLRQQITLEELNIVMRTLFDASHLNIISRVNSQKCKNSLELQLKSLLSQYESEQ